MALFSKLKSLVVAILRHPRLVIEFGVVCLIWLVWLIGPQMGLESVSFYLVEEKTGKATAVQTR